MSLANLLVPNQYNIQANSETLNAVAANPSGAQTLWFNSGNSHLFIGANDLQISAPALSTDNTIYFPAYTSLFADNIAANNWLMAKDANNLPVLQLTSLGTAAKLFMGPIVRSSITGTSGFKLTGFDVVYCNLTAMTSATATLSSVQFTDGVAYSPVAVPITGSFSTGASATNVTVFVESFSIDTPAFIGQDQMYNLELSITSPIGNQTNVYGVFIYFTNTY